MELTRLKDGIISVRYGSQAVVCRAFKRVQEFYENPVLKGLPGVTISDIDAWWKNFHAGEETYDQYWCGFNIPGDVYRNWSMAAGKLTAAELKLRRAIEAAGIESHSIAYIIGGFGKANSREWLNIERHEIAHALFCVDPDYRTRATALMTALGVAKPGLNAHIRSVLEQMGYDQSVIVDEMQAYLATGPLAETEGTILAGGARFVSGEESNDISPNAGSSRFSPGRWESVSGAAPSVLFGILDELERLYVQASTNEKDATCGAHARNAMPR